MALDRLDRLVNSATIAELKVANDIVRSREEFNLYTNLSRRFDQPGSTLSEQPRQAGDDFKRQGLDWVMALARLEWGAIAAGFSDAERPFDVARPSRLESDAYLEILADGMRSHYWALRADPVAGNPRNAGLTDSQAIAYTRRVHLTGTLLSVFRERALKKLAPPQLAELKAWEKDLARLQQTLLFDVLKLGDSLVAESTSSNTNDAKLLGGINASDAALAKLPHCVQNAVQSPLASGDPSAGPTP